MKKRILLFTAIAGFSYLTLMSNAGGPAIGSGGNRTGARASTANCGGGGCHGTGTSTVVTITVDSGTTTTTTTHYKPGHSYTIKIHGTNSSSLPKFGFEFAAVQGSGATQSQAGTFAPVTSPIFADSGPGGLTYIEHGSAISGTSAGVYDASFVWNAPTTNVGNVTLYCTLNAVNGNGLEDNADISGNTSVILTPIVTTSVTEFANALAITAYPNPTVNSLNLQMVNAGAYSIHVFDLNGRTIANETVNGTGASLNTGNWAPGLYQVVVENGGSRQIIPVVKQ